jgi:hypothetical protein
MESMRDDATPMSLEERYHAVLNRLAKWRSVFAGWQLGTRADSDPECKAVRDHREATILLRAEVNALTRILLDAKICTLDELSSQIIKEAEFLDQAYRKQFPGFKATDYGMSIDSVIAQDTMRGWRP